LRGFSMLELVLVLVIIGVVSAVVVPRFGASVARYRLEAAAQRVTADLRLVRQRAQQASLAQTIVFDAVADTYGVATMPDPDHPNGTYLVRLDRAPYEVNLVSADFGGDAELVFDGHGQPDSGGTLVLRLGTSQQTLTVSAETAQVTVSEEHVTTVEEAAATPLP